MNPLEEEGRKSMPEKGHQRWMKLQGVFQGDEHGRTHSRVLKHTVFRVGFFQGTL